MDDAGPSGAVTAVGTLAGAARSAVVMRCQDTTGNADELRAASTCIKMAANGIASCGTSRMHFGGDSRCTYSGNGAPSSNTLQLPLLCDSTSFPYEKQRRQQKRVDEHQTEMRGTAEEDWSRSRTATVSDVRSLPLMVSRSLSLSLLAALSPSEEAGGSKGDSNSSSSSSSSSNSWSLAAAERAAALSVRRCSSGGAAPNHVPAVRHSNAPFRRGGPRVEDTRMGLCYTQASVESGLYASLSNARRTGNNSGACSSRSNACSDSSSKHAPPWASDRQFCFSGVTTRSLWSTRICACRPSPVLAANRNCSSSSCSNISNNTSKRNGVNGVGRTLNPEAEGPAGLRPQRVARGNRRHSSSSSSSSSDSDSNCSGNSKGSGDSSRSSLWDGELRELRDSLTKGDSDKGDATQPTDFDDPLERLQTMQLQHQPRSPLLLLRCSSSQEADMLQQIGGDTCPLLPDALPNASDTVSIAAASDPLASAAAAPVPIPASVGSYYGFTLGAEVRARVAAYEEKTASQRRRQTQLWEAYLASNPCFEDRRPLKRLVRRGIPDHLRGRVWAFFLGADALLDSDPKAFERLQMAQLPVDVSGQIELDLPRTFPNNKRFRCSGGICALRRVLRGFAAARPGVGYCQGLNFLAGTLLLFQEQELALASLLQLVVSTDKNKGLQIGRYYSNGMADLRRDLKVLELLIRQKSPRVFQVLKKTGVEVEWVAAEWFLCLFATSCPQPTVLRIWDCLMLEGPKILFRVALGVIFYFESQLAKMHSLEQVMGSLKAKLALLVEHNELLRLCFHKLRSFPRRKLQKLQQTIAAGLVDPTRPCGEEQQQGENDEDQQEQQQHQQSPLQDSRRRRLLPFRRTNKQQPSCDVLQPQPASQIHFTWREKLSRVSRLGMKRQATLPLSGRHEGPPLCASFDEHVTKDALHSCNGSRTEETRRHRNLRSLHKLKRPPGSPKRGASSALQ
ncbi:TBC domain-containing protein, putative [Eimeria maxima]|uniref:TBC domain-containing protein, putative n=1 Tax=Eimeria maxima TaxID=5804 RepID=U6MCN2_EIMMA|nr:TBC domain-containing protein, putative [Eimeria maxima]CDJ59425.1 TBC domain-containing protein, putative [Eimeria maxima]